MKKLCSLLLACFVCVAWVGLPAMAADKKNDAGKGSQPAAKPAPEKKTAESKPAPKPQAQPDPTKQQATQCDLAKMLVEVLGLARFLPAAPSCQQAFAILLDNGISPLDGWDEAALVVKGDLARVIVQALKKQMEVKNPDDPKSWIEYLKSIGIPIDSVGEAVSYVGPLSEPVAPNVMQATTDPLRKRHKFDPLDETQYGVDMAALVRILSEMERNEGEFRPKPITED